MAYENLDKQLINALIGNGRASLRSLSEELDVSVTTVSNHINDLEDEGVITEYTPMLNYGELVYGVTAVLQLKVEGQALSDVVTRLQEHKQITTVYETTGEFDVIGIGTFRDTEDVNQTIKQLLNDVTVRQSSTAVVLNRPVENQQFELDVESAD